jgi:ubiquinone/menaquinone biosynthesis C-methylase UbiE
MTGKQDHAYYATGDALRQKHRLVRTASGREFHRWALDRVAISPGMRVLDAGCGWGRFTWSLIEDYGMEPRDVVCADLSFGMVQTASGEASQRGKPTTFCVADIQRLPFKSGAFDGALANHVLYHLPDLGRGARELARVLAPGGWLLATTNSDRINPTIIEMHYRALDTLGVPYAPEGASPFSMENGGAYLETAFHSVERFYFEDETRYYTPDDFVGTYLSTGRYRSILERDDVNNEIRRELPRVVERLVQEAIAKEGFLRSPILMGAFVCTNPA